MRLQDRMFVGCSMEEIEREEMLYDISPRVSPLSLTPCSITSPDSGPAKVRKRDVCVCVCVCVLGGAYIIVTPYVLGENTC